MGIKQLRSDASPQRPLWGVISADGEQRVAAVGALSPGMKLRSFFEGYVLDEHLACASARTIKEYRTTLSYWEQFSGDPPLAGITTKIIAAFRKGLPTLSGRRPGEFMAANTQRKHCVNLQFILDRAGPKLRRDLEPAKLLADVPYVQRPGLVIHDVVDNFSLAEIGLFLDACDAAPSPRGLSIAPACFWRCLGLFLYNVGPRPQTFLELRFEWLEQDEFGWWLQVPAWAMKAKRGARLYVNSHALRVVERMRACGSGLIFPWTECRSWSGQRHVHAQHHKEGWLHTVRRKILVASEIPARRHLGFKGFRKACSTQLARINPMAASLQLSHRSGSNVTRDWYTNREIVAEACEQLPQPKWCEDFGERQLTLF
jgi:integrase